MFGAFSIADAMFVPVASRFETYGIRCEPEAEEWCRGALGHPAMRSWSRAAGVEREVIAAEEKGEAGSEAVE